jgi:RNase P subunit RPR2
VSIKHENNTVIEVKRTSHLLTITCSGCDKVIPIQYSEVQTIKGHSRKLPPGTKIGYCSNCDSHKTILVSDSKEDGLK